MNTEVETAAYALGKRSAGVRWAQHPREAPPRDHEDRGTGLLSVQGACPTSTRGRGPRRLRAPRLGRPAPRVHASSEGARGVNSGLLAVVAKPVPAVPSCPEASGSCLRATPERRSQVPARPLAPCGNPTPPWGHPRYPSSLPAVFDVTGRQDRLRPRGHTRGTRVGRHLVCKAGRSSAGARGQAGARRPRRDAAQAGAVWGAAGSRAEASSPGHLKPSPQSRQPCLLPRPVSVSAAGGAVHRVTASEAQAPS